jgi:acetyl-CoA C-acetyltransferase
MFEQALRVSTGESVDDHRRRIAELWARFNEVAVRNPHAWIRKPVTSEDISQPGPTNRMISWPYTKLMNSNNMVDQGAALILTSVEAATRLGIPTDRWVYPYAGTDAHDTYSISERADLHRSPAIRIGGTRALELAGSGIDDMAYVDLYSCFPSAVQVAAAELGLPVDDPARPLTVTGGLTFAGGPWNDYVSHAVATMVGVLREDPDSVGLCSANGGLLTKHAIGLYSCQPPSGTVQVESVQAAVDALPTREAAPDHAGGVTIETYTVMHDRDGNSQRVFAFGLLEDGRRTLAATDDAAVAGAFLAEDPLGRTAIVRDGVLLDVA